MDDKNNKNFDDLIIQKKESKSNKVPNEFDTLITSNSKPKSSVVSPSSPKINIDRAASKSQSTSPSGISSGMSSNPFEKEAPKSRSEMRNTYGMEDPGDIILPTKTGFSVKNPSKDTERSRRPRDVGASTTPTEVELFVPNIEGGARKTSGTPAFPSRRPTPTQPTAKPVSRDGKVSVSSTTGGATAKPTRQVTPEQPKSPDIVTFEKTAKKAVEDEKAKQPQIIEKKVEEPKKAEVIVGEQEKKAQATPQKKDQKPVVETPVVKTTTSTLKKKPGTVIPEDKSQEGGAKAGSKKYKADTRLDRRARSLKKYGKEFEKWRRSQEVPEDEEFIEGDVLAREGRHSERVITTALVLVVVMVLSMFLLFYCNILVPGDQYDDGRVRISVEIEKDPFTEVDINGNITEKIMFPGDYIDFDIKATNAYNIAGDNATAFIWDSVFVRFKIYMRIDGEAYEEVRVNINNLGTKTVPVLIPTMPANLYHKYTKELEDQYIDPIKQRPIIEESDGYYYYNGILNYNETLTLCEGLLLNGDAIIPDFANKRAEIVIVIDAATADYTSIRERTIWETAPQYWIEYMHDTYFSHIA